MKQNHHILLICIAALLAAMPIATQAASLKKQLAATERLLTEAETELARGNKDEAIQLYGATITAYEEVERRFPKEESELIDFRVNYCRNQLMHLLREKRLPDLPPENAAPGDSQEPPSTAIPEPLHRATVHCRMGQFSQALALIDSFIETTPDVALGHLLRATARLGLGKREEAIDSLKEALRLDPDFADAHYNLAQLLLRDLEPDFEAARTHYERAIELGGQKDPAMEVILAP